MNRSPMQLALPDVMQVWLVLWHVRRQYGHTVSLSPALPSTAQISIWHCSIGTLTYFSNYSSYIEKPLKIVTEKEQKEQPSPLKTTQKNCQPRSTKILVRNLNCISLYACILSKALMLRTCYFSNTRYTVQ